MAAIVDIDWFSLPVRVASLSIGEYCSNGGDIFLLLERVGEDASITAPTLFSPNKTLGEKPLESLARVKSGVKAFRDGSAIFCLGK